MSPPPAANRFLSLDVFRGLAVALMMNSLRISGVAYLFNSQVPRAAVHSLADATDRAPSDAV